MLPRRSALGLLAASLSLAAGRSVGAAVPKQLRIGYQKGEPVLVAAKANRSFETLLQPLGVEVTWLEFPFGPPILEAMRVGSVDVGAVGDAPPIFAQAGKAELVYIGARHDNGDSYGILLPPGSTIRSLQELKGKRVAFAKASSAHNFTLAALEKAALSYADITPVPLAPADAAAAFEHGDVDAWTIWDPYLAIAEARPGVRLLVKTREVGVANSFYLASRDYANRYGDVLWSVVQELGRVGAWCEEHRPALANLLSAITGVPLPAWQLSVDRARFVSTPIDQAVLAEEQVLADRFRRLGLIPVSINVRDWAWRATS